jgi:hypothetical protein
MHNRLANAHACNARSRLEVAGLPDEPTAPASTSIGVVGWAPEIAQAPIDHLGELVSVKE